TRFSRDWSSDVCSSDLAILLRVGIQGENAVQLGQRLLQEFGGLVGLQRASFVDVCGVKGLGPAKAAQIKAAIELGRRLAAQSFEIGRVSGRERVSVSVG